MTCLVRSRVAPRDRGTTVGRGSYWRPESGSVGETDRKTCRYQHENLSADDDNGKCSRDSPPSNSRNRTSEERDQTVQYSEAGQIFTVSPDRLQKKAITKPIFETIPDPTHMRRLDPLTQPRPLPSPATTNPARPPPETPKPPTSTHLPHRLRISVPRYDAPSGMEVPEPGTRQPVRNAPSQRPPDPSAAPDGGRTIPHPRSDRQPPQPADFVAHLQTY
jgi:hypothetical protein